MEDKRIRKQLEKYELEKKQLEERQSYLWYSLHEVLHKKKLLINRINKLKLELDRLKLEGNKTTRAGGK